MVKESITKSLAIMENQIIKAYLVKLRRYQEDMSPQVSINIVENESKRISPIRENPASNPPEPTKTQVVNHRPDRTAPAIKLTMPDSVIQVPDSGTRGLTGKAGIFISIKRFFSRILSK